MSTEQIAALETKIMFQEQAISELNNALCQQQLQLTQLKALCMQLVSTCDELRAASKSTVLSHERPPHY